MWDEAIDDFATALRAAGRSESTIRLRRYYLGLLGQAHCDPWAVTTADLRDWLASGGWRPNTLRSALQAVRGFYRWAHLEERVDHDPASRLEAVRQPRPVAKPTPDDVLEAALAGADDDGRLMILLAAYAGLRRAEIAALHMGDIRDGWIVVRGKGGRVREVPLHPVLGQALAGRSGFVFPGRYDGHLSAEWVGKRLRKLLGQGWSAHTLRHRFLTRAYLGTHDLFAVQELAGHASPVTTRGYVALDRAALVAAALAAA